MHKKYKILFIFFALFILCANSGFAQRRGQFNLAEGLSITPKGGYNMFFGDLVDESRGSYSMGALAEREINQFLSARALILGGKMQGRQVTPNTGMVYASFDNAYTEFTIGGAYRPLNHLLGYFKQRTFQPYAHLNAGMVFYNSTEYWGEASGGPIDEEWRSASGISPVVSLGGGATIWINPSISTNIEFSGALPFTDLMDVHDVWYASVSDWENNINPYSTDPYDFYYTFTLGVTFTLQDSKLRNDPRYNRKSYIKTRSYYQSKSQRNPRRRNQKRFLFF